MTSSGCTEKVLDDGLYDFHLMLFTNSNELYIDNAHLPDHELRFQ
jgi:hypothetical protein